MVFEHLALVELTSMHMDLILFQYEFFVITMQLYTVRIMQISYRELFLHSWSVYNHRVIFCNTSGWVLF